MSKVGRPLKFESTQELQDKIDAYFAECDPHMVETEEWEDLRDGDGKLVKDENGYNKLGLITRKRLTKQIPYTITGLALALNTTRETLLDYEDKEEFTDTIKAAKLRCENYNEQMLYGPSPTGTIFNLKNNYGWKDRTEQENSGEQKLIVETRVRKSGNSNS
jgi:hypothetical protein